MECSSRQKLDRQVLLKEVAWAGKVLQDGQGASVTLKAKVRLYSHQQNIFGCKFDDVTYIAISRPAQDIGWNPVSKTKVKQKSLKGNLGNVRDLNSGKMKDGRRKVHKVISFRMF